jgi:hypothetical protein
MRERTERERADQLRARLHRLNTEFLTYSMTTLYNRSGECQIRVYVSENGEPRELDAIMNTAAELRGWITRLEDERAECPARLAAAESRTM